MQFKYSYGDKTISEDTFDAVIKNSKTLFYKSLSRKITNTFTVRAANELNFNHSDILLNHFELFFNSEKYPDKINFITDYEYIVNNVDELKLYSDEQNMLFYPQFNYEIHFNIDKFLLTLIYNKLDDYQRYRLI